MLLLSRGPKLLDRFLWWPAILFALLARSRPARRRPGRFDPAVRFLGAMQICIALGVGAGIAAMMAAIWRAKAGDLTMWWAWIALLAAVAIGFPLLAWSASDTPVDSQLAHVTYFFSFHIPATTQGLHTFGVVFFGAVTLLLLPVVFFWLRSEYAIRTTYSALAAAALVFAIYGHGDALRSRIHVLPEYDRNHPAELTDIINHFEELPPGRKQAGAGAENHWWNQLPYVYAGSAVAAPHGRRRPAGVAELRLPVEHDQAVREARVALRRAVPRVPDVERVADAARQGGLRHRALRDPAHPRRRARRADRDHRHRCPTARHGPTRRCARPPSRGSSRRSPEHDRFLAYPGSGPANPTPGDGRVNRSWRQDSSGDSADIVGEVFQTTPTTYVFRESWHPRWHAYVDGIEKPIRRVTPDFPAVDITSPGKHVIALRFERPFWAWACWLFWPGLTLAALVDSARRRRGAAARLAAVRCLTAARYRRRAGSGSRPSSCAGATACRAPRA